MIFIATEEQVDELEVDENPADSFPCMSTQGIFRDARAQLYSLVTGEFFDDALTLEVLHKSLTDEGPFIYQMDPSLQSRLARLEEDEIGELAGHWLACEELETLDVTETDLYEFMYQFAHFCYTATNDGELSVFIYSDS